MKRTLCVLVCLIMILGLMPYKASAAQETKTEPTVVDGYYQNGTWVEGEITQTLPQGVETVEKTATKVGDNEYRVTLTVETSQTVTVTLPDAAATVLVIDTSGSMDDDNKLVSAKQAAKDFIASYRGDHTGIGRYIAIVDFSSRVSLALDWTDVSTTQGNKKANSAIDNLYAGGGTNLQAGLYMARKLMGRATVAGILKTAKNVVALTDGAPTYALKDFEESFFHPYPDLTIDGDQFDFVGNGKKGSQTINNNTASEAASLAALANIYTICYGAAKDETYKNGPKVGDFLKNSIASSKGNAYDANSSDELAAAFKAIGETIVNGLNGNGMSVTDQTKKHLILSGLPSGTEQTEEGFTWTLKDPTTRTVGDTTYYTYTLEYTVMLDANAADFVEGEWYPLNGETQLHIPDPDGGEETIVDFPIPAGKGVKSRYTVTFVDDDDTELQKETDVVHGTTPTYKGETPTKEATDQYTYTFAGWTPTIVPATEDAIYKATYTASLQTYTVTWADDDGTKLEEDLDVPYGTMPSYDGETPTKEATAQYTYTFDGWTPNIQTVTGDVVYTATYTATTNKYTVTWNNDDGTQLEQDTDVEYGSTPSYDGQTPTKEATAEYTYSFSGWTPAVEMVTGNAIYTATYNETKNKYTVTWLDEDGTELEKDVDVEYGTMPSYDGETPTKEATAQYTYTFAGWDKAIEEVHGNQTYTATYSAKTNAYTVTWADDDGTKLEEDLDVPYGTMPSYDGETPTKEATAQYTYTFGGWTPNIQTVTGDVVYTATYTATTNKYTVTWNNDNGTQLEQDTDVEYGSTPSYDGQTPTKDATAEYTYSFSGWTPAVEMVTGNAIYTATYNETKNKYTVTWLDEDGTELEKDVDVEYGTMPSFDGETPTKEATAQYTYTFNGWDKAIEAVHGNQTYTATYKAVTNTYTVTWADDDGTKLEEDLNVPYGTTPSYDGETPTKEATAQYTYTFGGWTPNIQTVTGDVVYTATYTATTNKYTVTWNNDNGTQLEQDTDVEYGSTPSYDGQTPTKDATDEFTYVFNGWSPTVQSVTGDATYTATYTATTNTYTVTWLDEDGTELEKDVDVAYGTTPSYDGETPTKEGTAQYTYTFNGWDKAIEAVHGNQTYTATYKAVTNTYTVTWNNDDGSLLEQDTSVPYGTTPTYDGNAPTKPADAQYTYTFTGWTPTVAPVTGDQTYTAVYSKEVNTYTITWVNYDDSVLETDQGVPYGTMPNYNGDTPQRERTDQMTYTFEGWTPEVSAVTGNATYKATFSESLNAYTVRWVDDEGNELEVDQNVLYGATPSYDGQTPTKAATDEFTYTFTGWNPTVATVTGDITYTAIFDNSTNLYTVTWVNYDNTLLEKDEDVPYGTMPSYDGETPSREQTAQYSYFFAGWNPAVDKVTGNITYTAFYRESVNSYNVKFVDEDGTVLQEEMLEYGTMPSYQQEVPTKEATPEYTYTFASWTPALTAVTSDQIYTASYSGTKNTYVIRWVDEDGTVLEEDEAVEYGETPVYNGETPTKEATPKVTFFFDEWTPEVVPVVGNATYTATYSEEINSYKVTWVNEDGTELEVDEKVEYGTMPTYDGKTPVKAETEDATYTFEKWDPEVSPVTGDVTYKAVFKETKKEKPIEEPSKPKPEPPTTVSNVPKTGEADMVIWFVLIIVGMGAIGLVFSKKRSLHHEK